MVSNPNKNNKMYRRIYNPAKHLRWSVLQKQQKPNDFFCQNALSPLITPLKCTRN